MTRKAGCGTEVVRVGLLGRVGAGTPEPPTTDGHRALQRATRDLGETDHLIARIATDAGFPDVKAFNTAFRRTFGRTPSAYRRLLTADTAAADEIFHHRRVSRRDETVMRVLRTWASRAAGGTDPCATASLLTRPSPVEEALELARTLTARLERMADGGPGV